MEGKRARLALHFNEILPQLQDPAFNIFTREAALSKQVVAVVSFLLNADSHRGCSKPFNFQKHPTPFIFIVSKMEIFDLIFYFFV